MFFLHLLSDRIIQHYTKNPLVAYSGTSANPIAKVEYHLCDGQHSGMFCVYIVRVHAWMCMSIVLALLFRRLQVHVNTSDVSQEGLAVVMYWTKFLYTYMYSISAHTCMWVPCSLAMYLEETCIQTTGDMVYNYLMNSMV